MAVSKIPNPTIFAVGNTTGTIQMKHAQHKAVIAPTKEGYRFFCWLYAISEGWIGNLYFEQPTNSSTNVWVSDYGLDQSSNGNFRAYCLYVPT